MKMFLQIIAAITRSSAPSDELSDSAPYLPQPKLR
jgi:hypothetical protein